MNTCITLFNLLEEALLSSVAWMHVVITSHWATICTEMAMTVN
jgi:hypothetical protein